MVKTLVRSKHPMKQSHPIVSPINARKLQPRKIVETNSPRILTSSQELFASGRSCCGKLSAETVQEAALGRQSSPKRTDGPDFKQIMYLQELRGERFSEAKLKAVLEPAYNNRFVAMPPRDSGRICGRGLDRKRHA